jgi:hypothetical protein
MLMIFLYNGFAKYGWESVKAELGRFAELLFRSSETYRLALILFMNPSHIIGGIDPEDVLRQALQQHLPGVLPKTPKNDD